MTKAEARSAFLQKRSSLTDAEWQAMSVAICQRFFSSVDISFIKKVHTYLPIEGKKEPDTWMIVDKIRREHPHIRLVIPRIDKGQLSHFFFEGLHQVKPSMWGIPEPTQGVPADPADLDMVIVPLLAADKAGNRVGYGKGFYDRFMKDCKPTCLKVGLSLFPLIDSVDDVNEFDIRLDAVVTPDDFHSPGTA
jgi:5-formyltetrahydrofolate cyclo-ligase